MCDCHTRIRESLTERFKAAQPTASAHHIELQGYGFAIVDGALTLRPFMHYKAGADYPVKKTGGSKWKSVTGNMAFSFCPFCGERIGAQSSNEQSDDGSPARQGAEPDGQDLNPVSVKDLSASASPATKEQQ